MFIEIRDAYGSYTLNENAISCIEYNDNYHEMFCYTEERPIIMQFEIAEDARIAYEKILKTLPYLKIKE